MQTSWTDDLYVTLRKLVNERSVTGEHEYMQITNHCVGEESNKAEAIMLRIALVHDYD